MKIELDLPVAMRDKELTNLLTKLNQLEIPHHINSDVWYNRKITLTLNKDYKSHCSLLLGIMIGKLIKKH